MNFLSSLGVQAKLLLALATVIFFTIIIAIIGIATNTVSRNAALYAKNVIELLDEGNTIPFIAR